MTRVRKEDNGGDVRRVTWVGLGWNAALSVGKFFAGYFGGSQALVVVLLLLTIQNKIVFLVIIIYFYMKIIVLKNVKMDYIQRKQDLKQNIF